MRSRGFLIVVLLLLLGTALSAVVWHRYLPKPAVLELEVFDSTFGGPLQGRAIRLIDRRSALSRSATLESYGNRSIARFEQLIAGPQELRLELFGFRPADFELSLPPLASYRLTVGLQSISGRAKVSIVDARSRSPIQDSELVGPAEFARLGPEMDLVLPAGEHRLAARAPGFCDGERVVAVDEGAETGVELPLSPVLAANESARAVLDWGDNPRDLDAHVLLEESAVGVSNPHVFFGHKRGITDRGELFAALDVDHTQSEGFETVTISSQVPGTYRYFVHLYAGEGSLGGSEATVTITTRGCKKKQYRVPMDCRGRFWSVGDIRVGDFEAGDEVDILERGECSEDPPRRWRSRK